MFTPDELARKDFVSALGLWIPLEFVSFVVLPAIQIIQPGSRLQSWFLASLPLGVGGAFLVAISSRFMALMNKRSVSRNRTMELWLGQIVGWLGLVGIGFPLIMAMLEFFTKAFEEVSV
ncbi:MAG: hypothetical protein F6K19_42065 [Cyanothece sp. SIO1E1]|nr:hypothetical protein [Cyanothece sp. SIO1E1]